MSNINLSNFLKSKVTFDENNFNIGKFKGRLYDDVVSDTTCYEYLIWLVSLEKTENLALSHDRAQVILRLEQLQKE